MNRINDRILGGAMLLLAIGYYWMTTQFRQPFGGGGTVGPKSFPQLLAVVLALAGIWLCLKPGKDAEWPSLRAMGKVVLTIMTLVLFALLLRPIGFVPMAAVAITVLAVLLGAHLRGALICGVVCSISLYLLFGMGLDLPLPPGLLRGVL